jgi:hypothetical protein
MREREIKSMGKDGVKERKKREKENKGKKNRRTERKREGKK